MIQYVLAIALLFSIHADPPQKTPFKAKELDAEGFMFPPICGCTGNMCRRSSPFGMRDHPIHKVKKQHTGCDIAAPLNTAVYATANGEIQEVFKSYPRMGGSGYGNQIVVRHKSPSGETFLSHYAHLYKVEPGIDKGVKVKKGQKLGTVDSTGSSTGDHLHFEILRCKGDGGEKDDSCQKVDPENFVNLKLANESCESILKDNNIPNPGSTTIGR